MTESRTGQNNGPDAAGQGPAPGGDQRERRRSSSGGARGFAVRRTQARSWKQTLLRIGIVVAIVALLGWGLYWLRTSETFSVVRVETGSYRFTSEDELETILSGFLGRNIWTLSNADMEHAMADLAWVRDLRLRRRLPATVEIDFREWRPLMEVTGVDRGADSVGKDCWVLVEDGHVLQFPGHLVLVGLPVLTGVGCVRDTNSGRLNLEPNRASDVLALLDAIDESGLESVNPVDFVVARPEGFAIVLQENQGSLLVGNEEFSDRLRRYMEAYEHLEAGLIVDLRFKDRVTCRRPDPAPHN